LYPETTQWRLQLHPTSHDNWILLIEQHVIVANKIHSRLILVVAIHPLCYMLMHPCSRLALAYRCRNTRPTL